jgi:IclR family pca regulon transcriptional regulator
MYTASEAAVRYENMWAHGERPAVNDAPEPSELTPSSEFVQSLARGLAVIRAFDATHPELGLSEVARATGLTRATARRLLLTLVRLGYVRQDGNRFALRPRVLELGFSYLSALSLPELAQPHMEALVAHVNESSSIAVLDDTDIVYVVRVPTRRIMSITIAVGTRLPAYPTSMGRVLLAALDPETLDDRLARTKIRALTPTTVPDVEVLHSELERVRARGWAAVDQELEQGVRSVAVPIRNAGGNVSAAMNVSVHASRMTMQDLRKQVLPELSRAAEAIESELGAVAAPSARRTRLDSESARVESAVR